MKKVYMRPEWEMQNMEVEQLICFSKNNNSDADPSEDILINERPDLDDDLDFFP